MPKRKNYNDIDFADKEQVCKTFSDDSECMSVTSPSFHKPLSCLETDFEECFVETSVGAFEAYMIPKGTYIWHGTISYFTPDLVMQHAKTFFGNRETAEYYAPETARRKKEEQIYGTEVIYEYKVVNDMYLIAVDSCKNMNLLKKVVSKIDWDETDPDYKSISPIVGHRIKKLRGGAEEKIDKFAEFIDYYFKCGNFSPEDGRRPLRKSEYEADGAFATILCSLGLQGWAAKKQWQDDPAFDDFRQEFFAEIMLCNPDKYLNFVQEITISG